MCKIVLPTIPLKQVLFILPTLHFPQQSHDLATFIPMNLRQRNEMFVQLQMQQEEFNWAKKFPRK